MSDDIQANPPLPLPGSGPNPSGRYVDVTIRKEDDPVDISKRSWDAIIRACYAPPLILTVTVLTGSFLHAWRLTPLLPPMTDVLAFPLCILVGIAFICFAPYSPLARLVIVILYVPVMAFVLLNIFISITKPIL